MKLVTFVLDTSSASEICTQLNALGCADYVFNLYPDSSNLQFGGRGNTTVFVRVPDDFDTSQLPNA